MRVGDLVTIKPAKRGVYMITSLDAHDLHHRGRLRDAVTVVCLDDSTSSPMPMGKKWLEVINASG
jgi:hypothetical protein